jgi:hypothetical protein
MRTIALIFVWIGAASPLQAQQRPAPLQVEVARPGFTAVEENRAAPERASAADTLALSRSAREAEPAAQAVLDEAFWRQVLAGVIVAVVSTLILRAIF